MLHYLGFKTKIEFHNNIYKADNNNNGNHYKT